MSVDRISREISRIMASKPKKPQPYDTIGVVQGVRDGKAWVRFAGSDQETPVQMTIDAKEGNSVMVRVAGGRAFIIGNDTAPPTDDRAANEAHKAAKMAYNRAVKASEEVAETNVKVAENAEFMANKVIEINADIEDLQSQIDGNITSWFYAVDPSMATPPVSEWTVDEYANHLGDLYYNTDSGYVWRFVYQNDAYSWVRVEDSDVTRALEMASRAQDTADSKRRIFVAQPAPPYDVGDLWVQGSTGDIMRCSHARVAGASYTASDWVKASKYTDDTVAQQALTSANVTSQYVTHIDSINGVRIMNAANSSNYSQIIAGAFDIYQSGVNISHQGYDNGNNSAGGSSKAPYYTFGTRASDTSTTRGNYSFAEGYSVTASGYCSHAEGYKATASGSHSHAEGSETEAASGTYVGAHAEGWHTKATATAAHAEGAYTEANASESHAGGFHTIAGYSYQTAIGQYNDNQEDNVFEIGWGTSSSRKNMFAVDKYGNALHYGDGVFDITSSITNVTTGTKVSAKVAKFGAVVSFHLTFTNTSSVASGSNVFAAKLNASKYRPLLDWATGGGYYGGASLNLAIDSSGNITVRNCGSSAITCRQNSNVVATYIVDGSTGL